MRITVQTQFGNRSQGLPIRQANIKVAGGQVASFPVPEMPKCNGEAGRSAVRSLHKNILKTYV
jgi:hypothetical protein